MGIRENLQIIHKNIELHAKKFGNDPKQITLVGVTKYVEDSLVQEALDLGLTDIGENQVQELVRKEKLFSKVRKHMIGRLQSNKVRNLKDIHLIHSIDRQNLIKELERIGQREQRVFHGLVQVNIVGEEQKGGVPASELKPLLEFIETCQFLKIHGLMNIGPDTDDEIIIRDNFRQMRKLFENNKQIVYNNSQMDILSMGMSNDYKIALEEGATLIRVGSAIFGKRNYQ